VLLAALALAAAKAAAEGDAGAEYEPLRDLMSSERRARRAAVAALVRDGGTGRVAALVDALFFTRRIDRGEIVSALEALTGERHGADYWAWVEAVGRHPEWTPDAEYPAWKLELLARIDRRYRNVFYRGAPTRIRVEEIVWGGVPLDGIPTLDDPPRVAADAAPLDDDEIVFAVAAGGAFHAWPDRYLSWHELVNDRVGGDPVALSYCTLCGSAVLFSTATPAGDRRLLRTSGLLYRSNKLMVDDVSWTLWSNLSGEPVVGRLAASAARLPLLPLVVVRWGTWRRVHPGTTVTVLDDAFGRTHGYRYLPGAAERHRRGVRFPVWLESDRLPRDEKIFGLRLGGAAKAWPVAALERRGVVADRVGATEVVLIAERGAGVRAYERGGHELRRAASDEGAGIRLLDERGTTWRVTEAALVVEPPADDPPLARLPGHEAYWFGWYGFYPATELGTP